MASGGSVTLWIERLKAGGEQTQQAAQKVWERYYPALLRLARRNLGNASVRVADEEDVVVNAFERFFRAAGEGRFPRLEDRDDLWQILLMLTERAASNQRRDGARQKRGGGAVRGKGGIRLRILHLLQSALRGRIGADLKG